MYKPLVTQNDTRATYLQINELKIEAVSSEHL